MRNLGAEKKFANFLFMFGGALFLFGLIVLGIGTEMLVLRLFSTDSALFWIWQGVWAVVTAIIISMVAKTINSNIVIGNSDSIQ